MIRYNAYVSTEGVEVTNRAGSYRTLHGLSGQGVRREGGNRELNVVRYQYKVMKFI